MRKLRKGLSVSLVICMLMTMMPTVNLANEGTVDLANKETVDLANKETVDLANKETVDLANEGTVDLANEGTVDLTNKETVDLANKETVDLANEETVDLSNKETVDMSNKETVDLANEETVDSANEETVDLANEETVDLSNEETVANVIAQLEAIDTLQEMQNARSFKGKEEYEQYLAEMFKARADAAEAYAALSEEDKVLIDSDNPELVKKLDNNLDTVWNSISYNVSPRCR